MSQTTTTAVGRPCSVCTSAHHADVDKALIAGLGNSLISRKFNVSPDAVSRHARQHLAPEARQALRDSQALSTTDLASRILAVADSARITRNNAEDSGSSLAALRAGDAEVKALSALADRLGVDDSEVIEQLRDGEALARSVGTATRSNPAIGLAIAVELRRLDAGDMADELEAHAANVKTRNDFTPLEEHA